MRKPRSFPPEPSQDCHLGSYAPAPTTGSSQIPDCAANSQLPTASARNGNGRITTRLHKCLSRRMSDAAGAASPPLAETHTAPAGFGPDERNRQTPAGCSTKSGDCRMGRRRRSFKLGKIVIRVTGRLATHLLVRAQSITDVRSDLGAVQPTSVVNGELDASLARSLAARHARNRRRNR